MIRTPIFSPIPQLTNTYLPTVPLIRLRFDKLSERFDKLSERFDKLSERFIKLSERFDKLNEQFDKLSERFDKLSERFIFFSTPCPLRGSVHME
jgi:acyl carrier protein phosphodiesterase